MSIVEWVSERFPGFMDEGDLSCLSLFLERSVEMASTVELQEVIHGLSTEGWAQSPEAYALFCDLVSRALTMLAPDGLMACTILEDLLVLQDDTGCDSRLPGGGHYAEGARSADGRPCGNSQRLVANFEEIRSAFSRLASELSQPVRGLPDVSMRMCLAVCSWTALLDASVRALCCGSTAADGASPR